MPGLDKRPDVKARLDLEIEKFLSTVEIEAIDAAAVAEFNANIAKYEARARELYLVDKAAFTTPAQVSATHILFDPRKRGAEAARTLAIETRAKIAAGADMGKLAREISDDPSSSQNAGRSAGSPRRTWIRRSRALRSASPTSAICPSPSNRSSDGT